MIFNISEEFINNKTYIFRGVSTKNSGTSNYSKKFKTDLNSRFYSWEIFDGQYLFGDIQVFELLDDTNILNLGTSIPVEEFIEEYNLNDYESAWLYKIYGIKTLNESSKLKDYHDLYHAQQLVATDYLENNTDYDGVCWYEPNDTPEEQIQIWNNNIIRRLSYKEAKQVIEQLKNTNPDMYDNSDYWGPVQYNLYRGK